MSYNTVSYSKVLIHGLGTFPIVAKLKRRKYLVIDPNQTEPELIMVRVHGCYFVHTLPQKVQVQIPTVSILKYKFPVEQMPLAIEISEELARR